MVKSDIELVRRSNRALILRQLRRRGPTARTVLADATGLSSATVSSITGEMLEEGALRQVRPEAVRAAGRGRPQTPLDIAPDHASVLVIGIWVDHVTYALHDHCGGQIAAEDGPPIAPDTGSADISRRLTEDARAFLAGKPFAARLAAVRAVVQGVTDGAGRGIVWSPGLRAPCPTLADDLERALGRPAEVTNDCAAMAEALHWRNPGRYADDFAVALIGYGVGMGLFLGGRPFAGQAGSAAELGHMNHIPGGALCRCGRRGCVEAYAADYAILRAAEGLDEACLAPPPPARMDALAATARAGDARARAAYAEAGRALGYGLGRVFAIVGPLRVAVVGRGAGTFDLLEDDIRAGLHESLVDALSGPLDAETFPDGEALAVEGAALTALAAMDAGRPRRAAAS